MKTKEELNAFKEEVEALNAKLAELNDEELKQVSGGMKRELDTDISETIMKCTNPDCGFQIRWAGVYTGKIFECPECKHMTLTGQ